MDILFTLTLCLLGNFVCYFFVSCFLKSKCFEKFFQEYHQNRLDPDQATHFVGPGLGSSCLQRFSTNDTSSHRTRGGLEVKDIKLKTFI